MSLLSSVPPPNDPAAARNQGGRVNWKLALVLVLANLALFGAGIGVTYIEGIGVAGLALTIPGAALVTFVIFFTDSRDIRTAVTGSFVVLYLGIVSASFNRQVAVLAQDKEAFFSTVFDSFQALMIVVVGFYFGGKSAEKVTENIAAGKQAIADAATITPARGSPPDKDARE